MGTAQTLAHACGGSLSKARKLVLGLRQNIMTPQRRSSVNPNAVGRRWKQTEPRRQEIESVLGSRRSVAFARDN